MFERRLKRLSLVFGQFEGLAAPLLAKIEEVAQKLLVGLAAQSDNKLSVTDINIVEIVGGAVRIPSVKAVLSKVFGREAQVWLARVHALFNKPEIM